MRVISVTSDTYVQSTALMLDSLRVWHPHLPVTVYALARGWTTEHEAALAPFHVTLAHLREDDPRQRGGADGSAVFCAWKTDVFAAQREPFLYLDSDTLVLKPLERAFAAVAADGWLSVSEGTPLAAYYQGEVRRLMELPAEAGRLSGFNAGVIGCDPQRHAELLQLSRDWARRVPNIYLGDQALLNLAWWKLHGQMPPSAGAHYNGGWSADDRVDLSNTIVHFARPDYGGPAKLRDQERVWRAWPRGVRLTALHETDWWVSSQPHPWPWINQCTRGRYREAVRRLRRSSGALRDVPWLWLRNRYEAFLLDRGVLQSAGRFWRTHGGVFRGVPHRPAYHLAAQGRTAAAWRRGLQRWAGEARSWLLS